MGIYIAREDDGSHVATFVDESDGKAAFRMYRASARWTCLLHNGVERERRRLSDIEAFKVLRRGFEPTAANAITVDVGNPAIELREFTVEDMQTLLDGLPLWLADGTGKPIAFLAIISDVLLTGNS